MPRFQNVDLSTNRILKDLPKKEASRLLPHLESISLRANDVLYRIGETFRYVYFPQGAVIPVLAPMGDGRTVAVSLVGDEGVLGLQGILGAKVSANLAVVQIPGDCLRIKLGLIKAEFERGGELHNRLLRYARYLFTQISQTAACNRLHLLEQRLARWLLMVHNRAKKDEFPVTHEFLALLLGSPRSEVTIAAGMLRKSPLICYGRGRMTILDRPGLESTACECYQITTDELYEPR